MLLFIINKIEKDLIIYTSKVYIVNCIICYYIMIHIANLPVNNSLNWELQLVYLKKVVIYSFYSENTIIDIFYIT